MKRIIGFVLAAVLLLALSVIAAAVPNGTIVNHTLYTDIVALIDNHPIRSYNVDNRTVVVAEDLRAYGFYAIWHAEERWLEVVRPVVDGEPLTPASYPDYKPEVPAGKVGTPAHNILATDIVTTIAGDKVESWNINGETCILFRDLERYGEIGFDPEARLAVYETMPYKVLAGGHAVEQTVPEAWQVSGQTTADSMTVTFTVNEDYDSWSGFLGTDKSDVTMDTIWSADIAPAAKVTVAFYPGLFQPGESLRHDLFDTLSALTIPSAADTVDFTNTTEVRTAVGKVFWVTLNGKAVSGDLFRSQGNGHVDFTFLFDKGFAVKAGDVITVTVSTGDVEQLPQTGTVPENASAEEVLSLLKNRFLYHEVETVENDYCYVVRGYFSGTSSGNANDLYVVCKTGGMKNLTASVWPYFQTVDSMKFGDDPKVLVVSGKVLSADKENLIASRIEVNMDTGETKKLP
ncbi:MAG: hypothetical protein II836_02505 [Clostridia bacterium]|nr:hypothetical protein [Clostridia bacterium]